MIPILRRLLPAILALSAASCTGWPRGWNQAKRASTADGISGAWIGTWKSIPTGHSGNLRCAVFPHPASNSPPFPAASPSKSSSASASPQKPTPTPAPAMAAAATASGTADSRNVKTWEYRYRASWAHFLCAGFTVDCTGRQNKDGTWTLTGSRDLGPLFGGIFTHEATVDGDRLEAHYHAAADHGTLSLRRVGK